MEFSRQVAIAILLIGLSAQVRAGPLELVIFGESSSDTGNMWDLSGGEIPGPPHTGGWSNGSVWVDHVASSIGSTTNSVFATNFLTGEIDNFALGGAYTGTFPLPGPSSSNSNDFFVDDPTFPGLQEQVARYASLSGGVVSSSALHVVWIGGNDMIVGSLFGQAPADIVATAVTNMNTAIADLSDLGATQFLLINHADYGTAPGIGQFGDPSAFSALATMFNAATESMAADLSSSLAVNIEILDFASLYEQVLQDPAAAGFPGGLGPCLGASLEDLCLGQNPDDHIFWDGLHLSSRFHGLIADAFLNATGTASVPLPGTHVLLTLGVALAFRRRRSLPN